MSEPRGGLARVLVVEDDMNLRETMAEYLTMRGCEVREARTGVEALLEVRQRRLEAVVLDLGLPVLDGIRTLRGIRDVNRDVRVVVVTAELHDEIHRRARALGASAVFSKPVALPILFRALGLPADEANGAAVMRPETSDTDAPSDGSGSRLRGLVVEDDPAARQTFEDLLKLRGYDTRGAVDGAGAIREVVASPPDIVLLDVDLPVLNGLTVLAAIRGLAPASVVIMISGVATSDACHRALNYGAFQFLTKPVALKTLACTLEVAEVALTAR